MAIRLRISGDETDDPNVADSWARVLVPEQADEPGNGQSARLPDLLRFEGHAIGFDAIETGGASQLAFAPQPAAPVTTPTLWKSQTQVNTTAPDALDIPAVFAVPLGDGGYVVVWDIEDSVHNPTGDAVVGQRYDILGEKIGGEVKISQFVTGDQAPTGIAAMPDGGFVVAYEDFIESFFDIYVRRYDASFNFLRTDVIENTPTDAFDAAVTPFADGSYVAAYIVDNGGGDQDVVARIVSPTGVVGAQFDILNEAGNGKGQPQLATLSNGNFVIVFERSADGGFDMMFAIRTAAGAEVVPSQFVVGGSGEELEESPQLAALKGGGFVVVWSDGAGDSDGESPGIRASLYTNAGAPGPRTDFLVNTSTAGSQFSADVVALADGGFLVTWQNSAINFNFGQRFDANGNPVGIEFAVKPDAGRIDAALLKDGRFAYAMGQEEDSTTENTVTSIWDPRTGPIAGTGGNDRLTSRIDGATVNGLGGNDVLHGMGAIDTLNGGNGNDLLIGRGGNDALNGFDGADRLFGGAGADVLNAGSGDDEVFGGAGNDKVVGGSGLGDDHYDGEAGIDTVTYASATQPVTVNLATGVATGAEIGTDELVNIENAVGGAGNDTLTGKGGANTLNGAGGNDTMAGRNGNDTYLVDSAGDKVIEAVGGGTDKVLASVSYSLQAGQEVEFLRATAPAGTTAINLVGNQFANNIQGNAGKNLLNGGAGNDVLTGLGGNDLFLFNTALNAATNVDVITDFNVAADTVRLDDAIFTALAPGVLPAGAFRIGAAAGDAGDRIIYNSATGALFYDADGTGATAAIRFAKLDPALALTNADFIVV
jgi:Ca2+-binding RTX toxin-like protein